MAKPKKTKQQPKPPQQGIPDQQTEIPFQEAPQPEFQQQPEPEPQQFTANVDVSEDGEGGSVVEIGGVQDDGWGIGQHNTAATGPWSFGKQPPVSNTITSAKQQAHASKQTETDWGWNQQKATKPSPAWGTWGEGSQGQGGNYDWGTDDDEEEEEEEEEEDNGWGHHTSADAWGPTQQAAGTWDSRPAAGTWDSRPATGGWDSRPTASAWKTTSTTPAAASMTGWRSWGEEAKRLSKASVPQATAGARASISSQQRAQIHNAFPGFGGPTSQAQAYHSKHADILPQMLPQTQTNQPQYNDHLQFQNQDKKSKKKHKKEHKSSKHKRSQSENADAWTGQDWGDSGNDGWEKAWGDAGGKSWGDVGGKAWGDASNTGGKAWEDAGGSTWGDAGWGKGRGGNSTWGPIEEEEEEEEYYEDDRRVHFSPRHAGSASIRSDASRQTRLWAKEKHKDVPYSIPSKTLAHAYKGTSISLHTSLPRNKISEYTNIDFQDSRGAALVPVQQALFGRNRQAKDRLHWMFPSEKDERVDSLINWIQTVSYDLGTYGLHRFLQSRERGALFTNATFRIPGKDEPAFDWLIFDQLQSTRDKIIQESVAMYDPAKQVIVFVFLPSPSGNSVAIWRRRINVPNNMRLMLQAEINHTLDGLRRDEDYIVHVDEIPRDSIARRSSGGALYSAAEVKKAKKKRKWWQFW